MNVMIKIITLGAIYLFAKVSIASPMLAPTPRNMVVDYDNGDRIAVICPKEGSCSLRLRVDGRTYKYTSAELGVELSPVWATLFSYPRSNPAYFTFHVSVYCPDDFADRNTDCFATGAVQAGQTPSIDVVRRDFTVR